ncbi:hypothetical protein [Kibdelosporangium phytohabitans]|uniref:Uncharacterized protein n=1 Tax=Kibdelosporangium phytohabitans TaxID=860235 RepID=A0A0N9HS15_9PSEU|nr:hypothetical protein [Kibdelosporangium phytohabitans]ALG07657.1 hypothetical protein AOZ06_12740 [Kibdelosporangium phytohabitans]ALG07713.1 hypothetical protein AOZ06_13060 [Kibdelosporangium phytohabitans]MBE1471383.1 hypothetical protein [Kibdelosporangium phytohabitans]
MARTEITRQTPVRSGAALALAAVDASASPNGMFYKSDGTELVVVKNADASSHTMTVDIPVTVDGQAVTDKTVTVAAGATVIAGPYGPEYRQADGSVYLNFDSATSMTVGVLAI